jgi:hypothetical protein
MCIHSYAFLSEMSGNITDHVNASRHWIIEYQYLMLFLFLFRYGDIVPKTW